MVNPVLMEKLSKYENQQRERQRTAIQQINEIDRIKRAKRQRLSRRNPFNGLAKLITRLVRRQEMVG